MAKLQGGLGPVRRDHHPSKPVKPSKPDPRDKDDPEPTRLRTQLHLSVSSHLPTPSQSGFRVVSVSRSGDLSLVFLSHSRGEAMARLRDLDSQVTREVVELRVQEWVGSVLQGTWEDLRRVPLVRLPGAASSRVEPAPRSDVSGVRRLASRVRRRGSEGT